MLGKFVTKDYTQDLFIKLSKLRQDERPIQTYLREFEQLTLQCEINEKPEQKIARFLDGLHKNIASKVRIPFTRVRIGSTPKPTAPPTLDKGKAPINQKTNPYVTEGMIKCFQCQGYGHFRKDCPSKRELTAIEVVEWESEGLVESEEDENLVLEEMEAQEELGPDQLNLVTRVHPNPYNLRCLNKGSEVKVSKQCLVPFSIGKVYKDDVQCDVVPMDACHLLLGRPWEFDRNTTHQGKENVYSFKHEGKKEQLVLILLSKEVIKSEGSDLSTEIEPLIHKFKYVFPKVLPSGLPPLRGIEHHINLVPGDVLPNRPTYRSDPTATKELQHQIEELMSKGFVRNSREEHLRHLEVVFKILREEKLFGKLEKCTFMIEEVTFLRYIVSGTDFDQLFEVECDTSGIGIEVVLIQAQKPVAYFSEKLNGTKPKYSAYDKEFYAIIKALMHWNHYLMPKPFVLHSDHEALKYINGQHK
ncbi:uncharacterized protein LOC141614158 [Silene latifolia]|uniref:uncharacterized protein LOC141614158 n=1 Tax=Silene latifolia TaxID=37657 RepID=UPI003D789444